MRPDGTRAAVFLRGASSASWSPAGSHIAFIRGGDPWVARRDGTGAKRVTDVRSAQLSLAWSPDGRWLVAAPVDRGDLLLVRADGSATMALTNQDRLFHSWPSWQRR